LLALVQVEPVPGYRPAVLAITGTNGKTTVTSLLGQLVQRAGKTVAVAGNIGPTLLDTLAAHMRRANPAAGLGAGAVQLPARRREGFEPTAAVVLNVTQDHLDWHGDMDAYAAAKAKRVRPPALMLLNRDDPGDGHAAAARQGAPEAAASTSAPMPPSARRHAAAARRLRH
jgi:UDP-N-acetylmuramoylalanine--D-glutamate ligase